MLTLRLFANSVEKFFAFGYYNRQGSNLVSLLGPAASPEVLPTKHIAPTGVPCVRAHLFSQPLYLHTFTSQFAVHPQGYPHRSLRSKSSPSRRISRIFSTIQPRQQTLWIQYDTKTLGG